MNLTTSELVFLQEYMSSELTKKKNMIKEMMSSKTSLAEQVKKTVDNVEMMTIIVTKIRKYLGEEKYV